MERSWQINTTDLSQSKEVDETEKIIENVRTDVNSTTNIKALLAVLGIVLLAIIIFVFIKRNSWKSFDANELLR